MPKQYLLGNEAIAHACLEAGVDFISGYPGTPSSEVIDTISPTLIVPAILNGPLMRKLLMRMLSVQHGQG
jgi:hypothetical protein